MSKLQELLATQAKLTEEVNGLTDFLRVVHGNAPLTMVAGTEAVTFEAADLGVELQILSVMNNTLEERTRKLEAVNKKVAAMEALLS